MGLALGVLGRSASHPVPSSTGRSLPGFKMCAKGSCRKICFDHANVPLSTRTSERALGEGSGCHTTCNS